MTHILLSNDTCPALRTRYRQYERTQRRTPSGRVYDSVTIIFDTGGGLVETMELTPERTRALRLVSSCAFAARTA